MISFDLWYGWRGSNPQITDFKSGDFTYLPTSAYIFVVPTRIELVTDSAILFGFSIQDNNAEMLYLLSYKDQKKEINYL